VQKLTLLHQLLQLLLLVFTPAKNTDRILKKIGLPLPDLIGSPKRRQ
jgi:hypothetical protein